VNSARRKYPWAEPDDLYQWGMIGLLRALRSPTRDPSRPLEPFAAQAIRNEIRNCPELRRGVDRVLLGRVSEAHDRLMAAEVRRPAAWQIAAEANRIEAERAARSGRPAREALEVVDVERGLGMLAVASPESIDARRELGWEPEAGEAAPGAIIPEGWFEAFATVIDRMIDDCGLRGDKLFVLRHLVFGTSDAASASEALGTSPGNVRVLKTRARGAIEQRVDTCLAKVGVHGCGTMIVAMALLGAAEDEVGLGVATSGEGILARARVALARGAHDGESPGWLLDLVDLLHIFARKVGET
jgi:DNA-directed RNA polymerase specialized sigma24 family protein